MNLNKEQAFQKPCARGLLAVLHWEWCVSRLLYCGIAQEEATAAACGGIETCHAAASAPWLGGRDELR